MGTSDAGHNCNQITASDNDGIAMVYEIPNNTKASEIVALMDNPRWARGIANARPIAAAPDLLAALRLVAQHGRIDNSEERMNIVCAAIAKASP